LEFECENASPARAADFRKLGLPEKLEGKDSAPKLLARAKDEDEAEAVLAREVLGGSLWRVFRTPDGEEAVIHGRWLRHIVSRYGRRGRRDARERFAGFIIPTLKDPDEIWLAGRRKRFIKVFLDEEDDKPMLLVLDERPGGFMLWTAYRTRWDEINKQRAGTLLYSRGLAAKRKDG